MDAKETMLRAIIPEEVHTALKIQAAREKITIKSLIAAILKDYCNRKEKENDTNVHARISK